MAIEDISHEHRRQRAASLLHDVSQCWKNMSEMPPMPNLIHSIAVCSLNLVVARHNQAGHDISNSNGYVNSDGGYHFTSREIEIGLLEVND
jgi:hypothetical protein